jgi:hypothetical protein
MADSLALYPIVDALQIPLERTKKGYAGNKVMSLKLGPWVAETNVVADTDYVDAQEAACFVHFHDDLWGYMVSDQMGKRTRLVLFNGAVAKMKTSAARTGKIKTTLAKLKPAIVAAFEYDIAKWKPIDANSVQ